MQCFHCLCGLNFQNNEIKGENSPNWLLVEDYNYRQNVFFLFFSKNNSVFRIDCNFLSNFSPSRSWIFLSLLTLFLSKKCLWPFLFSDFLNSFKMYHNWNQERVFFVRLNFDQNSNTHVWDLDFFIAFADDSGFNRF